MDQWCAGGDIASDGLKRNACPMRSSTQGAKGSSKLADCIAAPGNNASGGGVGSCPQGHYCPGGSVTGNATEVRVCPEGSTTASPGASLISQCVNPPGTWFDGVSVQVCPQGSYCPGGSVTGGGTTVTACPKGSTTANPGASLVSQCVVEPGYYCTEGSTIAICPQGSFCPGGSVPTECQTITACPKGSTTASTGSSQFAQCLVEPGFAYNGTAVIVCTAGNYCEGGPINDAVQTPCPGVTSSVAGASSESQCTCNGATCVIGSTCVAYGKLNVPTCVCTATQIPAYTPSVGTCDQFYYRTASETKTFTVVAGQPLSIVYDSFGVPDRCVDVSFFSFFSLKRRAGS